MSTAYVLPNPYPLTGNQTIDVTTNGYKWYFPAGTAHVLNWSVSASKWTHPTLQSTETQQDFRGIFGNISEFIDVTFNFIGYIPGSSNKTGYEAAYSAGSDLNITFAYNGKTSNGAALSDGKFSTLSATAFCYFPDSDFNSNYIGAPGDTWLNYNNSFIANLTFEFGTEGFALLLHEVLHGLGLKHPHDSGGTGRPTYKSIGMQFGDRQWMSVMSYDKFENGGDGAYLGSMPIGPMIFDAIALQYLYGESKFNAGNSTYDLSHYLGNYYNCQWDYSGVDTLDGSKLPYGIFVDLGLGTDTNGINIHHIGYVTTALDLFYVVEGVNPDKWTWLWGEYENINGTAYDDNLSGNELDNVINGGSGEDFISGGAGNDSFDPDPSLRGGQDTFEGGLGNDKYYLNSIYDKVVENPGEGVDTVYVGGSYSISGTWLENIISYSSQSTGLSLTGNSASNYIEGALGVDSLFGGDGSDFLVGNAGNDSLDGGAGEDYAGYSGPIASYSIEATATPGRYTVKDLTGKDGTDTLVGIEILQFSDQRFALSSLADRIAPSVISLSPADEATGVAVDSNVVISFSESVVRGAGTISLKTTAGVVVATYDMATSQNVVISGSVLTINPTSDLAFGASYRIELPSGVIKDLSGNSYIGTIDYNFSTRLAADTVAPVATAFNPPDDSNSNLITGDIIVTFSETIQRGSGAIVLRTATDDFVAIYDSATSPNILISGNVLTINPAADLKYSTGYKVQFPQGCVKDIAGNSYSGTSTFNFTTIAAPDTSAPTANSISPIDDARGVSLNVNVVLQFSEPIVAGNGNIFLKTVAGATVETFDVRTSPNVILSGSTLTIKPTNALAEGTDYKVEFSLGSVTDSAGNTFNGVPNYNFKTLGTAATVRVGTSADDYLLGDIGNDTLSGLGGDDKLSGGRGNDKLDGGEGSDWTIYVEATSSVTVDLKNGTATGGDGTDVLISIENVKGSQFDDVLKGDDGNNYLNGQQGNDTIDGGIGFDIADYSGSILPITASLETGRGSGAYGSDILLNIEGISGGLASDILSGDSQGNSLSGQEGDDMLFGGGGNDSISGGKGKDALDGGDGLDTAIFSGKITDFYIKYNRALSTVVISDHRSNADDVDTLKSIEKLQFSDKTFELLNPARTETAAFGKSQSFLFDPAYYLLKNPDLVPTVTLANAFANYQSSGAAVGASPNAWFDPVYYANRWSDLKALNLTAESLFAHYNLYGVWEGRSAGPSFDKFDGTKYLKDNPDVAAYVDAFVKDFLGSRSNGAIAHYVIYGANEGRLAYDTAGVVIEQAILIGTPG